jgi:hypothetical protein
MIHHVRSKAETFFTKKLENSGDNFNYRTSNTPASEFDIFHDNESNLLTQKVTKNK